MEFYPKKRVSLSSKSLANDSIALVNVKLERIKNTYQALNEPRSLYNIVFSLAKFREKKQKSILNFQNVSGRKFLRNAYPP